MMEDGPTLETVRRRMLGTSSIGIKLIAVTGLALLMVVPAMFVHGVIGDRTERAAEVVNEIGTQVGGRQTFLGPTLAIPYSAPATTAGDVAKHGIYLVFPAQASGTVKTITHERHRSLFKVPVFQADLHLVANFDLSGVPQGLPEDATLDWSHAEFVVGVSDPRGALSDATLTAGGKTMTLAPAQIAPDISLSQQMRLTLFGATAREIAKPGAQFTVDSALRFSGIQRVAVLAYGKSSHLAISGDWPDPGFDGGFLPLSHSISKSGFQAEWSVPFMARGVRAEGTSDSIGGLDTTALGTSFIEVADPYQSVNRSFKYVPLFLGLVFLSYFIFEVTARERIHPAQYLLVGVAQIIFYLLLLSLAERIGFGWGFLAAGAATVALLSANAGWIFASPKQALKALAIFAPVYGFIYMLLRLEDNALLVGAIASFAAVSAVMYFTRRMDWYSSIPAAGYAPLTPEERG